jgi:rhodanese-related sulfurtransferase
VKIAVVSSMYGSYDQPVAHVPQDTRCEFVLVTDRKTDYDGRVVVEPRPQLHPRLAAKLAKCRPDLYSDADVWVWVDASIRILSSDFVSWCVKSVGDLPLAQCRHPQRQSIAAEAGVSAGMAKYRSLPVHEQVASYLAAGYPDDWGLWATGVIVYRREGLVCGDAWLREQMRWTYQDQLSQPPLLYREGLRPVDLDGGIWGNPRFEIRGHRDHL